MDITFLIIYLVAHLLPSNINTAQIRSLDKERTNSTLTIKKVAPKIYTLHQEGGEVRKYKVEQKRVLDYTKGGETDIRLFLQIPTSTRQWQKVKVIKALDEPSDIKIRRRKKRIVLNQEEGSYAGVFPFQITWK